MENDKEITIVYTTTTKSTKEIKVKQKDLDKEFDRLDKIMPSVYVKEPENTL